MKRVDPWIRGERPGDAGAVRDIVVAAFDGRSNEADLVDRMRGAGRSVISLVAEQDGAIVGYILFGVAAICDVAVLALAPLAVSPRAQGRGIGAALVRHGLREASERPEPLVVVLGSPACYSRFGFRPARELGIHGPNPAWGDALQALQLPAYRPVAGEVVYPPEFEETGTL